MARHLTADDVRGWTYDDVRGNVPPVIPTMYPVPTAAMQSFLVATVPPVPEVTGEPTNRAARRRAAKSQRGRA